MVAKAEINPHVLSWARRVSGLDPEEAAKKAGTSPDKIHSWETGEAFPTIRQLRLLAKTYHRPTAFFFFTTPPKEPEELPDFRRVPDFIYQKSPNLIFEIRLARNRRNTALELFKLMGDNYPPFRPAYSQNDGVSLIASDLRGLIGVNFEEQVSWADPYEGLKKWIAAVEKFGVLVSQFSGVDITEARGFSIDERPLPIIAINAKDSPRGRIFTLIHELVHLTLKLGGLCDLHENSEGINDIEPLINEIAANFLVPSDLLLGHQIVQKIQSKEWTDSDIVSLSNYFMVSQEVILRRLLTLDRTSKTFYEKKRNEFVQKYKGTTKTGFIKHYKKLLRNNGIAYTSLVLNAYYSDVISAVDLSRYLGNIKLKHVESIEFDLGFRF